MSTFRATSATQPYWRDAAEHSAAQLGSCGESGTLGFVYATPALESDLGRIVTHLRERTGIEHWVGTVGEGVCATGREYYDAPAVVAMATDLPADAFRILPTFTAEVAQTLAATDEWRARCHSFFGILHGDPRNPAIGPLIAALADGMKGGFLVGGLTSSEGAYPQIADQSTHGGISGVLLSAEVIVATGLTQGCSLIGGKHVVTECQRNVLVSLDGRPALDVLKQDVGELLARDLARIAGYIFVALSVRGSDTGDYLVRNLVGIDPAEGLIAVGEQVQVGAAVQFARRDAHSARVDMTRMLTDLKRRVGRDAVRGALYISCLGRGRHLFGTDSEELRMIRRELGDVPLVGFYANGEISHNRLYGYTGVLTLFL